MTVKGLNLVTLASVVDAHPEGLPRGGEGGGLPERFSY